MSFYSKNKAFINSGLISGLVFALIMLGFDYYNQKSFSAIKFVTHFVLFGLFNGYMAYRKYKKDNSNN